MKPHNFQSKRYESIIAAIKAVGLKDGMTVSFHHHFRHGDQTVALVLAAIKSLKIKDLTISASSFTQAHECLVEYIKDGTVISLEGSAVRGQLGSAISQGLLKKPARIRSHGGRARAIIAGEFKIDVAFLAAASSDEMGNANGCFGQSICGAFGYAMVDARYASKVIVITDQLVNYPNQRCSIEQTQVDAVVVVDHIADTKKLSLGEIHAHFSPKERLIANNILQVIVNTKWFRSGFSFQTGTGGASQASLEMLEKAMVEKQITASFFLGGIIAQHVKMLEAGLVTKLLDVQSFDLTAAASVAKNPNHLEISADFYANPSNKGCAVNLLDYGVLSALEVDVNFNVNVISGADGQLRGASGGHCDVAFGSKVAIVAVPLVRGRIPSITKKVQTIVTPGNTVDVVVTETGICVNPQRSDLIAMLTAAQIPLKSIDQLQAEAWSITGIPQLIDYNQKKPVAIIEYRDGTIIDTVYQVTPKLFLTNE